MALSVLKTRLWWKMRTVILGKIPPAGISGIHGKPAGRPARIFICSKMSCYLKGDYCYIVDLGGGDVALV